MGYTLENSIKVENEKTFITNRRMRDIVYECDLDNWDDYTEASVGKMTSGVDFAEIIYDDVTDNSRWSVYHECVFKLNDKYYRTYYSVGATEMQDESPYECDGEWIEVTEVVPKEVTVIQYITK